ncbi:MAG: hypothetical protein BAJATHORv1_10154 [Candidatus Thorarchaeota archaeon]|nr:MAG: hypothetical protein BAJATHORv1_10154 [Candidatus Thorarchaeota archaeon]
MSEEEAYEFVKGTLKEERIIPYKEDELEIIKSIEQCINCGICINHCPVVAGVGVDQFSGPRSIAVELSRSPPEFWTTGDKVYLCTGCGTCREVCPQSVNIPEIVNMIRARIFEHRPDLVPKELHKVLETIHAHEKAFAPWDDPEDKIDSRDMRLERLGLPLVDIESKESADVLFYPGCQAEEMAQEVKEAAKVILKRFDVNFAVLDELSCCGLPARLIGDEKTARELNTSLKEKIKSLGVKMLVTTCAGCTSNISDIAVRDNWDIPIYHMIEYLIEHIGIDRLQAEMASDTSATKITIHEPCHLIKHTSRQILDYAVEILQAIPNVEVITSSARDSCCGGGGMVAYHAPSVAKSVVGINLAAIDATSASRVVTPCPLCTATLEDNLYRSGIPIDVDDLTVFIATHLSME